jgi:hypothetical protein
MLHLGISPGDGLLALPVRRDNLQVTVHMVQDEEHRRKMILDLVQNPQIVDFTASSPAPPLLVDEAGVVDAKVPATAAIGTKRTRDETDMTAAQRARAQRLLGDTNNNDLLASSGSALGLTAYQRKQEAKGQLTIVYVWRRFEADALGEYLKGAGVKGVAVYHAGLDASTRERTQRMFDRGAVRCIVATVAFGMGVDKADVRQVIHCTMPKSIESYMQVINFFYCYFVFEKCILLFCCVYMLKKFCFLILSYLHLFLTLLIVPLGNGSSRQRRFAVCLSPTATARRRSAATLPFALLAAVHYPNRRLAAAGVCAGSCCAED